MGAKVEYGVWTGRAIRTARKAGPCQYGRRVTGGPCCRNVIQPGDKYVEGEHDDYRAGGYAMQRWCMECILDAQRQEREAA